jgi:Protein of unknown function (DUF3891)
MLRMESESGWWLITHPDHARLAGAFAAQWGNERFRSPEPRARVLHGISCHDDGWAARDAHPTITRQGIPSAFSTELVGKYSAFEEIDLEDYLAVRDRAVRIIAEDDPYAGLLIAMHTFSLLSEHADRSTIAPEKLPILDTFLANLIAYQEELRTRIAADKSLDETEKSSQTILEHFRLLQACDNLSLLACVAYERPAHLLHPLPLKDGTVSRVEVESIAPRNFRLSPWPFATESLSFTIRARCVSGRQFASSAQLETAWSAAKAETLEVRLSQ